MNSVITMMCKTITLAHRIQVSLPLTAVTEIFYVHTVGLKKEIHKARDSDHEISRFVPMSEILFKHMTCILDHAIQHSSDDHEI